MRLGSCLIAVPFLTGGLIAINTFREVSPRPAVVGWLDLITVAIAVTAAIKGGRRSFVILSIATVVCLLAYIWSTLVWSGGYDGPGLLWLYIGGPLHLGPVLVAASTALIRYRLEQVSKRGPKQR
jgi:hypothetical protein